MFVFYLFFKIKLFSLSLCSLLICRFFIISVLFICLALYPVVFDLLFVSSQWARSFSSNEIHVKWKWNASSLGNVTKITKDQTLSAKHSVESIIGISIASTKPYTRQIARKQLKRMRMPHHKQNLANEVKDIATVAFEIAQLHPFVRRIAFDYLCCFAIYCAWDQCVCLLHIIRLSWSRHNTCIDTVDVIAHATLPLRARSTLSHSVVLSTQYFEWNYRCGEWNSVACMGRWPYGSIEIETFFFF